MALSIEHQFAEWVRQQQPAAKYLYFENCGCAFYQFLDSNGYPVDWVGGFDWTDKSGDSHVLSSKVQQALVNRPWTFGALAKRLAA